MKGTPRCLRDVVVTRPALAPLRLDSNSGILLLDLPDADIDRSSLAIEELLDGIARKVELDSYRHKEHGTSLLSRADNSVRDRVVSRERGLRSLSPSIRGGLVYSDAGS